MLRNYFICLVSFFLVTSGVFAATLDSANQRFRSGDFTGAAQAYEKILTDKGPSAAIYYNLGNTYQSLKQYGPAILAYERARLLSPRESDVRANLALARKGAGTYEETGRPPWLESSLTFFSRRECSWLVTGAAAVLGLLFFLNGLIRLPGRLLISTSVAAAFIILTFSSILYMRRGESRDGIIIADQVRILLSPFEKADSLGSTSPGRRVTLGQKKGDFYFVEVPGVGLHGWVSIHEVTPLIPEAMP